MGKYWHGWPQVLNWLRPVTSHSCLPNSYQSLKKIPCMFHESVKWNNKKKEGSSDERCHCSLTRGLFLHCFTLLWFSFVFLCLKSNSNEQQRRPRRQRQEVAPSLLPKLSILSVVNVPRGGFDHQWHHEAKRLITCTRRHKHVGWLAVLMRRRKSLQSSYKMRAE